MKQPEFPFVEVSDYARPIVGEPTPGTRLFRREGSYEQFGEWFEALQRIFRSDVGLSPGGVTMYVPVSRSAVHKRLKEGKLTGFTYYVTREDKSFFGKKRKAKQRPYIVLSISECKAWAEELKRRLGYSYESKSPPPDKDQLRIAGAKDCPQTEKEEAEIEDFIQQDPKDLGDRAVAYKEPPITRREIMFEIQSAMRFATEEILCKLLPGKAGEKHRKRLQDGGLSYNYRTKKWSWKE
ncbi:MAG: hypothetical protein ABIQ35_00070 [Verrucomicrobiota bacterium]